MVFWKHQGLTHKFNIHPVFRKLTTLFVVGIPDIKKSASLFVLLILIKRNPIGRGNIEIDLFFIYCRFFLQ